MPDFDVDFCMDRRDEVIAYVQKKYGETSVGQIATFAELKAKSVIKDVARVHRDHADRGAADRQPHPAKDARRDVHDRRERSSIEPKLKARYETDPRVKELLDQARKLEGLTRHAGKHAAGIVISEGPLWDHVPVFRDDKTRRARHAVLQGRRRAGGLVKFDFLGLKTLTVLDIAVRLVNARPDSRGATARSSTSRASRSTTRATYELLASGETKGVFQLESSGMQQLFKDLRADCFEDIVAAVALYRPGPLGAGMVRGLRQPQARPRSRSRSCTRSSTTLLAPTYGVIVYQEQVMQIAQTARRLHARRRRSPPPRDGQEEARGDGQAEETSSSTGAKAKGVDEKDAERIFGLLEYFAGYGFNKSHSAAYALITYQTA